MRKDKSAAIKRRLESLTRKYECGTKIVMPVGGIAIIEDAMELIEAMENEIKRLKATSTTPE